MSIHQRGMTLLELLVAMVIFTLIAMAGYGGLRQALAVQSQLAEVRDDWERLDAVMTLIEQDLNQARSLPPRLPLQDAQAFRGSQGGGEAGLWLFTRGGVSSFYAESPSPYARIRYEVRDHALYRNIRDGLNVNPDRPGVETLLLDDVQQLSARYLAPTGDWLVDWPLRFTAESAATLPVAVELTLTLAPDRTYRRLFHVGPPR